MVYEIDGLRIKSHLFKSEEMSLMTKIWVCITILAVFWVLSVTVLMPVQDLIKAIGALTVIGWANKI